MDTIMSLWIAGLLIFNFWTNNEVRSASILDGIVPSSNNTEVAIIRRDLNFTQLVDYDGYKCEWHHVVTDDGYILSMFRVSTIGNCSGPGLGKPPLVFMHGLYLSPDDCIVPGPQLAHCYIYADHCLDVWAPSARGSVYSRNHTTLNPDTDPQFWNFTFDDMALHDMPAIIDYVTNKTGSPQITFAGHSQGAVTLLNLCAKKPEYNNKITHGFGLSTTAWFNGSRFVVLDVEAALSEPLTQADSAGLQSEFLPRNGPYQPVMKAACGTTDLSYQPCSAAYFSLLGYDNYQLSMDTIKVLMGHVPAGTSLKNFDRWGQIKQNGYTEYDYGPEGNQQAYNQLTPPIIDLSNVTMSWTFVLGVNDYLSTEVGIDILISYLPNSSATKCVVSDVTAGHYNIIVGKCASTLIAPMILSYAENGVLECL